MSSPYKKIQKNAQQFEMDKIYQNMTPEQYRMGIRRVAAHAAEEVSKEYERQMEKMKEEYNRTIRDGISMAMDTVSIEIIYELGKVLNCYDDEPTYLDQKIDIVQNLYSTVMENIKKYAAYKNDHQAQKAYEKKKKVVEKVFKIYGGK